MDEKLEKMINIYNNALDEADKARADIFEILEDDYGYDESYDGEDFEWFETEPHITGIDIDEVKRFINEVNSGERE